MNLPITQTFNPENLIKKKKPTRNWYWSIFPLSVVVTLVLFSFRPNFDNKAVAGNFTYELDNTIAEVMKIEDATMYRSKQTKNVFAKTLNINAVDENHANLAISIFDVKNAEVGNCISLGNYYGEEHKDVLKNFTYDLGVASFSNKCNLIYQSTNNETISSRNGWVNIESCIAGKISGSFEFKTDSGKIFSKGKFENVMYQFSE